MDWLSFDAPLFYHLFPLVIFVYLVPYLSFWLTRYWNASNINFTLCCTNSFSPRFLRYVDFMWLKLFSYYASPTSGEAYRDRQLTTNFELWVEIFCVSTCFHVRIPKPCLSVRPSFRLSVRTPRKEITLASSISVLH